MSKININRNIFLEKEELLRWQKFMLESPINKTFLSNTIAWGIIDTSGQLATPNDFKVDVGTNSGTVKMSNLSRALQNEGLIIEQTAIDNIIIPNDSSYYWLKIGHQYSNLEEGTVSITADGQITGSGTVFTDILRGQSTEVPVKVKLISTNNTGIYDVVDVLSDTSAILQGESFAVENGVQYFVIGSTPLGDTVTTQQENGLYYYDSCLITQVVETVSETEPAGKVDGKEFWIARVINNSGTVTIEDKRSEYWEYFIRGVSDKLDRNENLSDVQDVAASRGNLEVLSEDETKALLNIDDTGWKTMANGDKMQTSGTLVKIRRIGNLVNIMGYLTLKLGETILGNGDTLVSIAYSSIGRAAAPTTTIFSQINLIEDETLNHGLQFQIAVPSDEEDTLIVEARGNQQYMPDGTQEKNMHFSLTYFGS